MRLASLTAKASSARQPWCFGTHWGRG